MTEDKSECSQKSSTDARLVSISPRPDRRTEDEGTKEVAAAAAASGRMYVPAVLHRHFAHLARVRVRRDG